MVFFFYKFYIFKFFSNFRFQHYAFFSLTYSLKNIMTSLFKLNFIIKIFNQYIYLINNIFLLHFYFLSQLMLKQTIPYLFVIYWTISVYSFCVQKNLDLYNNFLKKIFVYLPIFKHYQFLILLKLYFKVLYHVNLLQTFLKGFFIKFKGKIGFVGNSRKRVILLRYGKASKFNLKINNITRHYLFLTQTGLFTNTVTLTF